MSIALYAVGPFLFKRRFKFMETMLVIEKVAMVYAVICMITMPLILAAATGLFVENYHLRYTLRKMKRKVKIGSQVTIYHKKDKAS